MDEEKLIRQIVVSGQKKKGALIQGPLGETQKMTVINESGLYALVVSSGPVYTRK